MIGIFDSGIGGLTVVKALKALRPDLPFVYLGDTARAPYGTKSPETIRRYAEECARFLLSKGAKAIIVACNTASSLAADHLKGHFPKTPVFEVITPAVAAALAVAKKGRIGLIGTRATVASGVYEKRLKAQDSRIEVFARPAPLLVSLVEEGWIETAETASIVGKYLAPLRQEGIEALILGCTHYPLLKRVIASRLDPETRLIDSAEETAKAFCATIELNPKLAKAVSGRGPSAFYVTDPTETFVALGSEWLGEEIAVSKVSL